jgi:hypothetical protein
MSATKRNWEAIEAVHDLLTRNDELIPEVADALDELALGIMRNYSPEDMQECLDDLIAILTKLVKP